MNNLQALVRPNIFRLKPYSSARDEFTGKAGIFLDANENPYGSLNRYPDPYQRELKAKLAAYKGVNPANIFIGNGSDEVIDLAFRIFCRPGQDKALSFSPSYGMYDVAADINDTELIKLPLRDDFQIDTAALSPYFNDECLKLIFICSPNNPTGNCMNAADIDYILQNFKGIVLIDEAYIDFSEEISWNQRILDYPNLIVSQTFSKAWGLAAARVGTAYMNADLLHFFNKVKAPYNVSQVNQEVAMDALDDLATYEQNRTAILQEKKRLKAALKALNFVRQIYPSDANFFLVEVNNANEIYQQLIERKIIIRNRHKLVNNCIRITIGKPEENQALIKALQGLQAEMMV